MVKCAHFVVTVLSKLVTSLKETESLSSEQELSFLQSLLESREINALVNVHSKVGKVCKDEKCAPLMSSSIQASLMTIVSLNLLTKNIPQVINKLFKYN